MKAASGDTDKGGDIRLRAIVEGLSLDMLCVLDLIPRAGGTMPDEGRDMVNSGIGVVMVASICG